jgi:hypothetical protein
LKNIAREFNLKFLNASNWRPIITSHQRKFDNNKVEKSSDGKPPLYPTAGYVQVFNSSPFLSDSVL